MVHYTETTRQNYSLVLHGQSSLHAQLLEPLQPAPHSHFSENKRFKNNFTATVKRLDIDGAVGKSSAIRTNLNYLKTCGLDGAVGKSSAIRTNLNYLKTCGLDGAVGKSSAIRTNLYYLKTRGLDGAGFGW